MVGFSCWEIVVKIQNQSVVSGMWVTACLLAFQLVAPARGTAQPAEPAELQSQIDRLLDRTFLAGQPGAAVIVVHGGQTVYQSARGKADLELNVPLSPNMVFRLGSITKQFTAAAVMMLREEGRLSLDDPLSKFLPDYPPAGAAVTVRQLLNHTSGIRSYTGMPEWMATRVAEDLAVDELIAGFSGEPLDFPPGTEYRYNNSGYVLLGAIIEKVSGLSYAEFIRQRIFTPLDMHNSYYGDHSSIIPNRAEGYDGSVDNPQNARYISMSQPYAAGSLLSTVGDLAKWNTALFGGQVVNEESLSLMTTASQLTDGTPIDYGFGLVPNDIRGHRSFAHGGGIFGFASYAAYLPDDDVYVAVLCNCSSATAGRTATQIAALAAGDPFPEFKAVELDEKILQRYTGVYRIDETGRRYVTLEDGQLYTQRSGGSRQAAIPYSETGFFYEVSPSHFEFLVDESGHVTGMNMYQAGSKQAELAARVDEELPAERPVAKIDFAICDDYVGEYRLAPGFTLTIRREGDRLFAQGTGQPSLEIFPASETTFFARQVAAEMTFQRDDRGNVTGLLLKQGGQQLTGKRK
jgi:CubicO group peptidase (beta-lactamase class C family)